MLARVIAVMSWNSEYRQRKGLQFPCDVSFRKLSLQVDKISLFGEGDYKAKMKQL